MKQLLTHAIEWVRDFAKICLKNKIKFEIVYNLDWQISLRHHWGLDSTKGPIAFRDKDYIEITVNRITAPLTEEFPLRINITVNKGDRIRDLNEFYSAISPQHFFEYFQALITARAWENKLKAEEIQNWSSGKRLNQKIP